MNEATFDALTEWFKAIVSQIEKEWLNGVTGGANRKTAMEKLGKLVGQANGLKDNLQSSLTNIFSLVPPLSLPDMVSAILLTNKRNL
jgi:hypothetical protein